MLPSQLLTHSQPSLSLAGHGFHYHSGYMRHQESDSRAGKVELTAGTSFYGKGGKHKLLPSLFCLGVCLVLTLFEEEWQ